MAYPKLSERYYDYRQQDFAKEWQQSLSVLDEGDESSQDSNALVPIDEQEEQEKQEEQKRKEEQRAAYIKTKMEGMLKIKKINLNLPILKGITEKNLEISVASMEHTGKMGEIGNYAIAGHRSRTFGKSFNRLDELEIGDIIEAEDGKNLYQYTVTEKLYVLPEDTWVLESNNKEKEITLITCHPMINPTHRLIIKGTMIG